MQTHQNDCLGRKGYSYDQCILHKSEAGRVCQGAAADRAAEGATGEAKLANTSVVSSGSPDDTGL